MNKIFSGFYDKNLKEIYIGDILKYNKETYIIQNKNYDNIKNKILIDTEIIRSCNER